MSNTAFPDRSNNRLKLLYSGHPEGPMPEDSEDVDSFEADETDLNVYRYPEKVVPGKSKGHYTLEFDESDYAIKLRGKATDNFEQAIDMLEEEGPSSIIEKYDTNSTMSRLGKNLDSFEYNIEQYIQDFRLVIDKFIE